MADFSPLGAFDASAPLLADALSVAKAFLADLPELPRGELSRVYLHWSAEDYSACDGAYNAVVQLVDGKWTIAYAHDVRNNAFSTFSEANYAAHTLKRNHGGLGIAINGLIGAFSAQDFGSEPIQMHELEFLCAGAAAFCVRYGIGPTTLINDGTAYRDEFPVLTHSEAANMVGDPPQFEAYGPQPIGSGDRIDLVTLTPIPAGYSATPTYAKWVGDALRIRTGRYIVGLRG